MKYLLHHSDSVYDDTTKRWQFTLDKRIGNPINIKISKLSFTAAVAASYPPLFTCAPTRSTIWRGLSTPSS